MVIQFVVNPGSGSEQQDIQTLIKEYFTGNDHQIHILELKKEIRPAEIKAEIERNSPNRVVAAGGDGTIKLVAQCIMNREFSLGILPAGSANGMALEQIGRAWCRERVCQVL